jgi:GNAT superfamily N-acetyltransferase
VELREATWADVDACFGVQRRSAVVGYARIFPQDEYPFPDEIVHKEWVSRLNDDRWVLIALIDDEPVGTIATRGNRIESLFVVPEQWGAGVSDALHDAALQRIAEQGAEVAELEVMADNLRARRFYERRGWERDGREEVSPFPPYPPLVGYRRVLEPVSRSKA